jgi:hypothetical protein
VFKVVGAALITVAAGVWAIFAASEGQSWNVIGPAMTAGTWASVTAMLFAKYQNAKQREHERESCAREDENDRYTSENIE